jgi:hypothetical protein
MSESPEQLERRVAVRMERQKILKENRLKISAVLDEAVLSRPVGGSKALRGQLGRLIELAQFPDVSIRVLPLSIGAHPGGDGPFRIIELSPLDPSVVHLEYPDRAVYLEEESGVRVYANIFKCLEDVSMTDKQSLELISKVSGGK